MFLETCYLTTNPNVAKKYLPERTYRYKFLIETLNEKSMAEDFERVKMVF